MVATVDRLLDWLLAWLDEAYASISRNAAFWGLVLLESVLLCGGIVALALVLL
jgi:hypothetical protein